MTTKNTFKQTPKPNTFTPTPKSVLAKTTGRDCSEYHQRNPPVFEDATVSMERKGLFWLGAIVRTEFRRF